MAVQYRFQSSKTLYSLPIEGDSIQVTDFNLMILNAKFGGNGKGFHFLVSDAQTGYQYKEEDVAKPITKNSSLIIRRRPNIIFNPIAQKDSDRPSPISTQVSQDQDSYDFGEDPLAGLEIQPNPKPKHFLADEVDEDRKIKAFVESSAADWQNQLKNASRPAVWRRGEAKGFRGFEPRIPPQGYVCRRCEIPGHFIQHCPTNGYSKYDKKEVRNPKGIPKHMLVADPEGSYALENGVRATLKPNEIAFDKQMEALGLLSSTPLPVHQEKAAPTTSLPVHQEKVAPITISPATRSSVQPQPTFRQVILQKIASSLASSKDTRKNPNTTMQYKENKLHPRHHQNADEEIKNKRQKTNFPALHCMPLASSNYHGNWGMTYPMGMHILPPQLGR